MQRKKHSGEFKTKVVLEVLKEEKTINEIGSLHQISPNLISRWKTEFMERMPKVFEKDSSELIKLTKSYEATIDELYTQIGKLTAQVEWLKKKSSR